MEELSQHQLSLRGQGRLVERPIHHGDPTVAGTLIQSKRVMAHPQPRMASGLLVSCRPAEPPHQEIPQANLGPGQVILRIHGAQHVIRRHLRIEGRHQSREPVFADAAEHLPFRKPVVGHQTII